MNAHDEPAAMRWWHELNTRDVRAAIGFYGRAMNWKFDEIMLAGGRTYRIARLGGRPVCGIFEILPDDGELPDHWMHYMATPDLEETLRAVAFAGGRVLRQPFTVPGVGDLALMEDAGGAIVGLIAPQAGHPLHESGAPENLPVMKDALAELREW